MSVISFEKARKQLEKNGGAASQSLLNTQQGTAGQTPTKKELDRIAENTVRMFNVVHKALVKGFKCKGQFARENAVFVAAAAQLGTITTQYDDTNFGDTWCCTEDGLDWLKEMTQYAEEYFDDETTD